MKLQVIKGEEPVMVSLLISFGLVVLTFLGLWLEPLILRLMGLVWGIADHDSGSEFMGSMVYGLGSAQNYVERICGFLHA